MRQHQHPRPGMVNGAMWLYTQCGLVQVSEQELQKWWANDAAILRMRVFDSADGVQAGLAPFQRGRAIRRREVVVCERRSLCR